MVQQRQLAERQRVAGNAAMAAGQWSEALRCYEVGLESQRHSMVLHANAVLAALKIKAYVQALEHCDKVWSLTRPQAQQLACARMHACSRPHAHACSWPHAFCS